MEELNFEQYGLKLHRKTENDGEVYRTYRSASTKSIYLEVYNFHNCVSIDVINGEERMAIAVRYMCRTEADLEFLLTRSTRTERYFEFKKVYI